MTSTVCVTTSQPTCCEISRPTRSKPASRRSATSRSGSRALPSLAATSRPSNRALLALGRDDPDRGRHPRHARRGLRRQGARRHRRAPERDRGPARGPRAAHGRTQRGGRAVGRLTGPAGKKGEHSTFQQMFNVPFYIPELASAAPTGIKHSAGRVGG